jgi:hypothetical protein
VDVFDLRRRVIDDYASYVRSFFAIRDVRIRAHVDAELEGGRLWPEPLLQVSPAFESGDSLDQLIAAGELHPACRDIFAHRGADGVPTGPVRLHRHQVEGLRAARRGASYVLTTGTGSGKSLAYIVPIVDHVLRAPRTPGIKAIVVYPMNALANSQLGELKKYLAGSAVTFRRYTGQENQAERAEIIASPPDILLTNYMMLELILTRPHDAPLLQQAAGLRFLVLDELHTYRGRQGADVAMLVRRTREASGARDVIHVGTSATLSGSASWPDQQREVAALASKIFGTVVAPDAIIGESLRRQTPALPDGAATIAQLTAAVVAASAPDGRDALLAHPLASWIESTLGVRVDDDGRLVRTRPEPLGSPEGAARRLADLTGQPVDACERAIRAFLLTGANLRAFGFRLHQFVSRGEAVFASPEPEATRYITLQAQEFVPDSDRHKRLLPIAFCRECGQEYYVVRRTRDEDGRVVYRERDVSEKIDPEKEDGDEGGFLYLSTDDPWPADDPDALLNRVPESWLEVTAKGVVRRKRSRDASMPRTVYLSPDGVEGGGDVQAAWFPAPFLHCLRCRVAYDAHQTSDFGKLATLGSEGRSTATTVLAMSIVRQLRRDPDVHADARKLLSFTDNRQDASLQAGHFNDFIEIALLRTGLWRAISAAASTGLRHDELALRVFQALELPLEQYARNPAVEYLQREETERALREVLGYYLYRDLRRGWRITQPNLEQTGLLVIDYVSLVQFAGDERHWQSAHRALAQATPERRATIARTLLDYLRRELCVRVNYLEPVEQERIRLLSDQYLIAPWSLIAEDRLDRSATVYGRSRSDGAEPEPHQIFLSPRGGFGLYLKRKDVLGADGPLTTDDVGTVITDLLRLLAIPGHPRPHRPTADHHRRPRLPGRRLGAGVARRHRRLRLPRPDPRPGRPRGRPARQPVLPGVLPQRRRRAAPAPRARAHRPGPEPRARRPRGQVPRRPSAGPVLLTDHGARRRHLDAERGQPAQRPADACQLRPAQRPRRSQRPARVHPVLLLDRQPARSVLLPAPARDGRRRGHPAAHRPRERRPAARARPRALADGLRRPSPDLAARRARRRRRPPTLAVMPELAEQAPRSGPSARPHTRARARSARRSPRWSAPPADVDTWLTTACASCRRASRPRASAGVRCSAPPALSSSSRTGASATRRSTPRSARRSPAAARRRPGPAQPVARRVRRSARRLLQLSLLRERRVPAGLQLPALAAVGVFAWVDASAAARPTTS